MIKKLLLIAVILTSSFVSAQITGSIKDESSQDALEYASVILYKQADGSLVTGVVTGLDGEFSIEKVKSGTYYLEASFIGFETKTIRNISITKKGEYKNLGAINLKISSSQLNEVVVRGDKATVAHKIDRQVFESDKFQNSQGGSAVDVVKNLPSVTVNGEGAISVRGSNSFAVLINGKPTQGDAASLLAQLPANALEKVELITAPSAKYDPEGTAGILNIITKKGATNGDYAQVNIRGGFPPVQDYNTKEYPQRYGVDVTYNTRNDLWNVSIGASYQRNDKAGRREGEVFIQNDNGTHANFSDDTRRYLLSDGERSFDDVSYNARFTADFTPNAKNEFSFGVYGGKRKKDRLADILYNNFSVNDVNSFNSAPGNTTYNSADKENGFQYYNHNLRTRKGDFALASFDYAHTFDNASKLSTSFLYEYTFLGGPTENDNVDGSDLSDAYKTDNGTIVYQQEYNTNDNPLNGMRFNLDYKWAPSNIGTFETGYQFRHLDHEGEFDYTRNSTGVLKPIQDFTTVPEFSSTINLKRIIHSAYVQLSKNQKKWDYAAGVRLESMDREYEEQLGTATNSTTYDYGYDAKLFPSASLQYKANESTNIKAAYSKRVVRTTTFKMNSFAEREHSEVYEQGDNQLKPEFIDLVELGVNKKYNNGNSVFATAYFRHTKNVINRVNARVYEDDKENPGNYIVNDSILNRVYSNVGKSNAIGLEVGATIKGSKNWSNFIGANVYNYAIDGALNFNHRDGVSRTYLIDSKSTIYSFNLNSTYKFWKNASMQFAFNYISDRNTAMGEDSRFYSPNLTFKKLFWDDNLAATLQWQNIDMGLLNTNEQRITTSRPNEFYTTTNYVYEVDMISLNLTYTFNKLRNKSKFIDSEFGKNEF
ncbi:TonB-dependent receptor domain-containing protein [Flavicella sediminum]|uniref:TonB-dependent receptor domain-containing protein n=1 Tax=Flavicella sediminum TaxID=2585141 RepID=UPI00111CDE21|nr:TonB-dependent receptor [Flavicella sediminum]